MAQPNPPPSQKPADSAPSWLTPQLFLMAGIGLVFIVLLVWTQPFTTLYYPPTHTPELATRTPLPPGAPTPFPIEYVQTDGQTDTIIVGAILLVLIVLLGIVSYILMSRHRRK